MQLRATALVWWVQEAIKQSNGIALVFYDQSTGVLHGVKTLEDVLQQDKNKAHKAQAKPLLPDSPAMREVRGAAAARLLAPRMDHLRSQSMAACMEAANAWRLLHLWTPVIGLEMLNSLPQFDSDE